MTLGERLKERRLEFEWTLREVERQCGVSFQAVSQIETGHVKSPSFKNVAAIADVLQIPLDDLTDIV